jgi:hypothetical protein
MLKTSQHRWPKSYDDVGVVFAALRDVNTMSINMASTSECACHIHVHVNTMSTNMAKHTGMCMPHPCRWAGPFQSTVIHNFAQRDIHLSAIRRSCASASRIKRGSFTRACAALSLAVRLQQGPDSFGQRFDHVFLSGRRGCDSCLRFVSRQPRTEEDHRQTHRRVEPKRFMKERDAEDCCDRRIDVRDD